MSTSKLVLIGMCAGVAGLWLAFGAAFIVRWVQAQCMYLRGATAHEFQIGRLIVRVCHLRGSYWAWRPWRRVTFQWAEPWDIVP